MQRTLDSPQKHFFQEITNENCTYALVKSSNEDVLYKCSFIFLNHK